MSSLDLLLQLLLCAATKTTAAKLTPLWRSTAAALLSRPATNALAASATVAVLLAHHCYTTAHYTIYIYKYASSAYTTRKAHLPMNAQVKEEEGCLGDPGLSWIQPHTIKSRPQPHTL